MSDNSAIEWTDATWNPVRGCTKVSPGCKNCYAETFAERWRGVPGHPYEQGFDLRLVPEKLGEPLRWKKPRRIFVNSMSDLFHEDVPNEFIASVWAVMCLGYWHIYQVLTKRADRMSAVLSDPGFYEAVLHAADELRGDMNIRPSDKRALWDVGISNPGHCKNQPWIWCGVSVEDRKYGLPRIEHLRRTPAAVRFLSIEPLLESLGQDWNLNNIDWVIVGGESGRGARPMHPDWVREIRDRVLAARRPCLRCATGSCWNPAPCIRCAGRGWTGPSLFFKQWGEWVPPDQLPDQAFADWDRRNNAAGPPGLDVPTKLGKKKAGRELDGRTWDEFPEVTR